MAIKSGFFNSVNGDRKYDADRFAEYFNSFIGNGVFPNPSDNLQVIANNDMTVTVKAGKAWINGYILINDDDYILNIEPADGVLSRIDRIVARYDTVDREIRLEVKQGAYSSSPIAPILQRDADAFELALADILVSNGVISITQANITDLRFNNELCGVVHGTVDQVDTTTIFNQYQAWFNSITEGTEQEIADWQQQQYYEFMMWFATIQDVLDGDTAGNLLNLINEHKADDVSQGEIHGLRVNNEKLEYYTGTEWKIASGGIPVGNVSGLSAEEDNAEITLMWTDPEDRYLDDLKIAEWQGTKIVRKEGSYPVSDDDGILVVDSTTRNQYATSGYKDTGLTNEVTYYYMVFPYTEDAITVDGANRISATPQTYDDLTGSPGAKNLISGTMEEGFFGEVSSNELITGDALASQVGISQGTSQHSTAGWLKFAYKGEIQFVAKKPIRSSISWDAINTAKCVYGDSGDKTVTMNGLTYKVTLMRALEPSNDPKTTASATSGVVNHYSEWNRLMCQIHEQAINKSWDYPDFVESDIGILEHSLGSGAQGMYNDTDLVVKSGDGRLSWCQEMSTSTSNRLARGSGGVSYSSGGASSNVGSGYGWRPVLELVP